MSDQVQTPLFEETEPAVPVAVPPLPDSIAQPRNVLPPSPPARVEPAWLRLAYACEFLIALLASTVIWTQIGGQGHLDLMPWYIKLACIGLLAWCAVRLTAAMVEHPKAWNRASRIWLASVLFVGSAMVAITYYVHLHEAPDEMQPEETATTSVRNWSSGQPHWFL